MASLGPKIRQRRLELGMTQGQLAKGLVSASAISQIESDKINPSYKLLVQIAERLEVPLDFFLEEKEGYLEQTTSHKLAKTLIVAKEYANAVPILENLLSANGGNVDETELQLDLAICHLELREYSKAQDFLEKVMISALKHDLLVTYTIALHRLGRLFYEQHNISLAFHYWQKAHESLVEAEDKGEPIDLFVKAEIITNLAITHNHLGNYDRSSELFRDSLTLLHDTTNLHHLATNYLGLGKSYYGKKEYQLAEEYCKEAITIFKSLDNIAYSIKVKVNFAIIQGENGDPHAALETLYECLNEYKLHGFERHSANAHAEVAKLLVHLSRLGEAKAHIDSAITTSEPGSALRGECHYVRALWHHARGEQDAAIVDAKESMRLFLAVEAPQEYHKASLMLSDIYKSLGDYKSATLILEESQQAIQNYLKEKGYL
ncbi:tetratricopeptide repeat protein [Tumebacillus sp. DT12]|uniref:Tetratricopeptide repeat protein n=1 Tax=Tumebacillus lacus TaxID=2995335 RepID=A0ABT3X7J1_9BACL|nr:tetratricopeptide repeat protein [Tumebacillus lacus]MCX7571555.1 tetratricopeptide repeat protein [Tumebacillus lacus]